MPVRRARRAAAALREVAEEEAALMPYRRRFDPVSDRVYSPAEDAAESALLRALAAAEQAAEFAALEALAE